MKIAIVSDLHLGYERFEEDAFNQAAEALEKASESADAILIPGDIFDKRYPRPEVISQAINIFRELSKKKWNAKISGYTGKAGIHTTVPIIAIPGTHERIAEGKENAVKLLSLAGLLADTSESTTTVQKGDELVSIFGLGGVSDDMVKEKIRELAPKPSGGTFSIFMFHQSIYEMLPFNDQFIRYADLPKGFDLYVCGHMHSAQESTAHGKKLLIPGSTVLTQLKSEEQSRKGFILFDTVDGTHRFVEIGSRPYVLREIEAKDAKPSELSELCDAEVSKIIKEAKSRPIIRLKISGTIAKGFSTADLQMHAITSKYSSKAFISIDTSRLSSPDSELMIEEIRSGRLDDMPIRELGMLTLASRIKESKIEMPANYSELFNILATSPNKEKAIQAANELLFGEKGS